MAAADDSTWRQRRLVGSGYFPSFVCNRGYFPMTLHFDTWYLANKAALTNSTLYKTNSIPEVPRKFEERSQIETNIMQRVHLYFLCFYYFMVMATGAMNPLIPHTHTHTALYTWHLWGTSLSSLLWPKPCQTLEFLLWGTIVPLNFLAGYYCSIVASTPQPMAYAFTNTHTHTPRPITVSIGKKGCRKGPLSHVQAFERVLKSPYFFSTFLSRLE